MAASDYVSLAQHQMVRQQRVRPTIFRDKPARPRKRVHASRPSGMVGSRYPYVGNVTGQSWGGPKVPHMDKYGEFYSGATHTRTGI